MDKIELTPIGESEKVGFFVVEQTTIGGVSYLLVTETEDEEAEAYILKDVSSREEAEASYMFVDDDEELAAVSGIFAELLEDVDIEL